MTEKKIIVNEWPNYNILPREEQKFERVSGYGIETHLPDDVMDRLNEYISAARIRNSDKRIGLAGNISSSLNLIDKDNWFFSGILNELTEELKTNLGENKTFSFQKISTNGVPYFLDNFWVNFQKQHEFNPLHDHTGLFSFVIFMKIPTDWREQHALPFIQGVKENARRASNFSFFYTNMMGSIAEATFKLDSSMEGRMFFFPAEMYHQVYPFYNCEEERITISGNIVYDV